MALEFFRNTTGRALRQGKIRIKLTPEGRATLKKKLQTKYPDLTDEMFDAALENLGHEMTSQLHKDLDATYERAERENTGKLQEKKDGRNQGTS